MNYLLTECACVKEDKIYWFTVQYNALCCYDLITQKNHFIGSVPWEEENKKALFNKMFIWGEKVVMMPFYSNYICIYDIKKDLFYRCETKMRFSNSIIYNNKIYAGAFDASWNRSLMLYDIEKNVLFEIEKVKDVVKSVGETPGTIAELYCEGEEVGFCYLGGKKIFVLNTVLNEVKVYDIPFKIDEAYAVLKCSKGFFVSEYKKPCAYILSKNGNIVSKFNWKHKINEDMDKIHRLIYMGDCIYINYLYCDDNYKINVNNNSVEKITKLNGPGLYIKNEEDLMVITNNEINKIQSLKNGVFSFPLDDIYTSVMKKLIEKRIVIPETKDMSIKCFIEQL